MSDDKKPVHQEIIIGDYFGNDPRRESGRVAAALRAARIEAGLIPDVRTRGARFASWLARVWWVFALTVLLLIVIATTIAYYADAYACRGRGGVYVAPTMPRIFGTCVMTETP